MPIFDPADLTFNGEEIRELSDAVFEEAFAKPAIEKLHKFVTGIVAKKQIAILGQLEGLIGIGDGECDPATSANTFSASQKFWNPVPVSDRLAQCWKDLRNSFWIWGLGVGIKKEDLTATDFFNYVLEILKDALIEMVLRLAWFNDTAADTVANGGVLTNGTEKKYFNKMNGFWKQIFAIVAATPARKSTTILTTRNAGASYAAQEFTPADVTARAVGSALTTMRFGSDYRLRSHMDRIFLTTQSVADQYEKELIEANVTYTTERLENGITMLKNGGMEVIGFEFWDRIIRAYQDNGTKYNLPHRALLMIPSNMQIGVEEVSTFSEFRVHFDPVSKKNFIDFEFNIDAVLILNYLIQASY